MVQPNGEQIADSLNHFRHGLIKLQTLLEGAIGKIGGISVLCGMAAETVPRFVRHLIGFLLQLVEGGQDPFFYESGFGVRLLQLNNLAGACIRHQ